MFLLFVLRVFMFCLFCLFTIVCVLVVLFGFCVAMLASIGKLFLDVFCWLDVACFFCVYVCGLID